jgi:hypothetical protein
MGDLVNLKSARKARARAQKEAEAAANRAQFGRSKMEKAHQEARAEQIQRTLDQARREE